VRLEEAQQGRQERRIGGAAPKLVRPDSGQVEEPAGPALLAERCRKCGEGKSYRILWRIVWT